MPLEAAIYDMGRLRDYFSVIHSAEDEAKGKPDPSVYLSAAHKLGVAPQNCLAIEDSVNGMKSALAADMKVIAIPFNEDPVFDRATAVIKTLTEVDDALSDQF